LKKKKVSGNDSSSSINSSKSAKKIGKENKRGRKRDVDKLLDTCGEDANNSRSSSQSTSVMIRASVDSESLEKIHTFSLKRASVEDSHLTNDSQDTSNPKRNHSQSSTGKAFYVEEKVKVMDNHVMQSEGILKELST
jgi:hypothetical protein